ncbi:MAG: hypothetical protein JWQ43_2473 [Glaciihabitans sp.]|nr:hypothetical protein [Glaciihabitans sp.]
MPDTVITVRGEFTATYPAERAAVKLDAAFDGDDREDVYNSAAAAAETVRGALEELHNSESGPVTSWSADSISVWSERPWNNEGVQLPLVYHSRLGITAKFSDFAALSRWIERVLGIDGVSIAGIDWTLTDARRTTVTAEVRSRAVKDAVAKATIYAQSIGLGHVTAIAVADPGMLGEHGQGGRPEPMMRASMATMKSGGPEVAFKPEEIDVTATVDARFIAT